MKYFTKEWRTNISKAKKGKKFTEEHKRNLSISHNKNRKPNIKKICEICGENFEVRHWFPNARYCSKKCFYKRVISPEVRKKYSHNPWNKGKKLHYKTGHTFKSGHTPWNKGKKGQSAWNKGKKCPQLSGDKNGSWKGGKKTEQYGKNWTKALKECVRQRDNHKCQICGVPQRECMIALDVHHIDYNKKHTELNNLISLCKSCHAKTQFKREFWNKYFKSTISIT